MIGGVGKTPESCNFDQLISLIKPGWQQGEENVIVAEEIDSSTVRKLTTVSTVGPLVKTFPLTHNTFVWHFFKSNPSMIFLYNDY